jgi:chloramphenicol-sensitive protein RarD
VQTVTDHRGTLLAAGAYLMWGIFPVYFKAIQSVPPAQILGHRVVWSAILLVLVVALRNEWYCLRPALSNPKTLGVFSLAACLLAANWLTYVWAVNAGYVVEASLGYFINPLLSVLLGVIFLREKLRPAQWAPVGLAMAGVIFLTVSYGRLPWIALALAFSFGLYGLIKKLAPLEALYGLTLETIILLAPCLLYLLIMEAQGLGSFGHAGILTNTLLALSGMVTVLPLLLFATAARRIPLYLLGILQYIAPTGQFLLGALVYQEPFTTARLVGFGIIWLALILYTFEGVLTRRQLLARR